MALVPSGNSTDTKAEGGGLLGSVLSGVFGFGLPVLKRVLLWYGNVVHKSLAIQLNRQFSRYGEWIPTSNGYSFVPKPEYSDSLPDQANTTRGDFDYKNLQPLAEGAEGLANWLWSKRRRPKTGGHKVVPYSGPKIEEIDMYRPRAPRPAPAAKRPVAHLDALMTTGRLPPVAKAPPRGRVAAAPNRKSPVEVHQDVVSALHAEHSLPKEQRLAARQSLIEKNREAAVNHSAVMTTLYNKRRPAYSTPRGRYGERAYGIMKNLGGTRKQRDLWNGRAQAYRARTFSSASAYGSNYTQAPGVFKEQKDGIKFSKTEYLAEVTSQAVFDQLEYEINPGVAATFPFLSQLAKLFQEYIFVKLKFIVRPRVSTTSSCGLFQAVLTNVKTPAPTSVQEIMTITGATESVSYKPRSCNLSPADLQLTGPTRAVRTGALTNTENADLYDVGRYFLARSGGDITLDDDVVGDLYVSYTIYLMNPIPDVLTLDPQVNDCLSLAAFTTSDFAQNANILITEEVWTPGMDSDGWWFSSDSSRLWLTKSSTSDAAVLTIPKGGFIFTWYAKINMNVAAAAPIAFSTSQVTTTSGTVVYNMSPLSATTVLADNVNDVRFWGVFLVEVQSESAVITMTPKVNNIDCVVSDFGFQINQVDMTVYDNFPSSLIPFDQPALDKKEMKEIKETQKEVDQLRDQLEAVTKLVRGMKLIQDHPIPPIAEKIPSGKKF